MSALASVQIRQLRLRGDTRAKTALLASLDSQRWPGDDDPRVIFINRLHVKAPWWMLARALAQQSEAEYHTAVMALEANAASNAVVFASEAQLVTQVMVNLLHHQSPWYQQTWLTQAQLAAEPLAVLLHRPLLVPEVLHQLHLRQVLADFLARCTDADLQRLLTRLQDFLAIGPSVNPPVYPVAMALAVAPVDDSKTALPPAQLHWAAHWLSLLFTPARKPGSGQLLLQLITCLGLWRFSPQQVRSPAAWSLWLGALADKAHAMGLPMAGRDHASQSRIAQRASPASAATESAESSGRVTAATADTTTDSTTDTASVTEGANPVTATDKTPSPRSPHTAPGVAGEGAVPGASAAMDYRFIQQAGFLYFINWLRDFEGISRLPAPFSPWLWLALLQRECCRLWRLPLDESLQALLLEAGGLEEQDVQDSSSDEWLATSLLSACEFLQRRMDYFHLQPSDWLAVPARVQLEQAHWQVYLHESVVRLDVRLAGLDLNPGWVPWLGRVMYFHFGQYPDLCGSASQ